MTLTKTTLSGAITATQTSIPLTSGSGILVGHVLQVDSEYMDVLDVSVANLPLVARGKNGSAQVAHDVLAFAYYGAASLFPTVQSLIQAPKIVTYGASGAIALPIADTLIELNKATAAAMTLANPTADMEGVVLRIVARTAAAHTVSNAAGVGFNGGGGATDVGTYGGAIGDNFVIVAMNGQWNVISAKNVTLG